MFVRNLIEHNILQLQSNTTAKNLLRLIIQVNTSPTNANVLELGGFNTHPVGTRRDKKFSRSCHDIRSLKDDIAVLIFTQHKSTVILESFCENTQQTFSLVHIVAACNMYKIIEIILRERPDINGCETKDGVTASYLAKMFKATETEKLLESTSFIYPRKQF